MQTALFNYQTLSTRLEKSTRTLFVTLNRPDWRNAFRLEMLFELESLFAWCTTRVEINSIFIDSSADIFSTGLELDNLSGMTAAQLEKINSKLQKIIFAMMQLPQTVIVDLGAGSETLGTEFALGADIRLASQDTKISFNHGRFGLVPAAGGMSMLATLTTPSFARAWILTGKSIEAQALKDAGFITEFYSAENRTDIISSTLDQVSKFAPVQRIQAKLGLFEGVRSNLENGMIMDRKIAKASMISEDWRTKKPEASEFTFMPAKSMSYVVKLSLVEKDERDTQNLEH